MVSIMTLTRPPARSDKLEWSPCMGRAEYPAHSWSPWLPLQVRSCSIASRRIGVLAGFAFCEADEIFQVIGLHFRSNNPDRRCICNRCHRSEIFDAVAQLGINSRCNCQITRRANQQGVAIKYSFCNLSGPESAARARAVVNDDGLA